MNEEGLLTASTSVLQKDITAIKLRRIQRLESRKSTDVKQTTNKALSMVHEPKLNEHVERISNIQITFLYTCVHKGERLKKKNLFLTCERTSNRQKLSSTGFIKGEALRLLRTNSSKTTFEENITLFKQRLRYRGYPDNLIDKTLSEVNFRERMSALQNKQKTRKNILSFVRGPNIGLAGCGISLFSLPGYGMQENMKAGSGMVRSGREAGSSSV